jgi:hypothetical protein
VPWLRSPLWYLLPYLSKSGYPNQLSGIQSFSQTFSVNDTK